MCSQCSSVKLSGTEDYSKIDKLLVWSIHSWFFETDFFDNKKNREYWWTYPLNEWIINSCQSLVHHAAGDSMHEGGTASKYSNNDTKQAHTWEPPPSENKGKFTPWCPQRARYKHEITGPSHWQRHCALHSITEGTKVEMTPPTLYLTDSTWKMEKKEFPHPGVQVSEME